MKVESEAQLIWCIWKHQIHSFFYKQTFPSNKMRSSAASVCYSENFQDTPNREHESKFYDVTDIALIILLYKN